MKPFEIFAAIASAIGIGAAGYAYGFSVADKGNQLIAQSLGKELQASLPEGTQSKVVTELLEGNPAEAVRLLSEGVRFFDTGPCLPAGTPVVLATGAGINSCESGIRAVFAGFRESNYPDYGTFSVGTNRTGAYPGDAIRPATGQSQTCVMIYEAKTPDATPGAKISFDCAGEEDG